ncbi:M20/M25/M40 family metallo-hydrolase [Steroidobacter sp.]|uniref:M20/M25/M40 family metallo-hydrolase n=1 Tax=Steroidobacter sp. TaxID=1978227 RepID=UPI001A4BA092|nr:M20/M25/M40 family metallo-hydrolase [Steroidobacter sp.]MBL8270234.1 M20/M25/M40 family metallo-hydrolase [Steroidobacter sp.]
MSRISILAVACIAVGFPAGAALAGAQAAAISAAVQKNVPEYLELLGIPNIPAEPADMQRNAAFLEQSFRKRNFKTQLLASPAGRPMILAELNGARASAATILFYAHFDGQPVIHSEWSQQDPFQPVVKKRDQQGAWQEVPIERLTATPLDPELRVFARSASDDKAPIVMLLTAIDVLQSQRKTPAINVKVLLDSEEEIGSPNLGAIVKANAPLFKADAMVVLDGPLHGSGRPTLVFGNRGITQATLTVFGPRAPLHSGHFGNYVPNPALRLAKLLASMKDDDGRVLVEGYYDGIKLTDADRGVLKATGDDESALLKRAGIARAERVGSNYQEALQYPSLNVRGMASASVGAKAANIVPSEAVAELDIRTTPETDGRHLFELLKSHIEKQGYRLVDAAPTEEQRASSDKLAMFKLGAVQAAMRMPMDAPVGRWAKSAMKSASAPEPSKDPVIIRMMGGTVPTDVLVDALQQPFLLVPTVNADNNQHTYDENMRLGNFVTGAETVYSLLVTKYSR